MGNSLWRHSDFRRLWGAQTVSVFGSQFTTLALPLAAVIVLQASPAEMGVLLAARAAPFLLFGLFVGVWVDRHRQRPIMIASDIGRGLVLITVPIAVFLGLLQIQLIYVVAFLLGVFAVFFDVSYQSYLPKLVRRDQLVEGNSKLEASQSIAQVTGPGAAGSVIHLITAPFALLVDSISFFLSATLLGRIQWRENIAKPPSESRILGDIREGLRVVFRNKSLRSIAGTSATFNFFDFAILALYFPFVVRDLDVGPLLLGIIFGLASFGPLAGALLASSMSRRFGIGQSVVYASFIMGAAGLLVPLASPSIAFGMLLTASFVRGFGVAAYNVNQVSLRQAIVPSQLLGRMNATIRFLIWGTFPFGALVGGILGEMMGLMPAILLLTVARMLSFLPVLLSPVRLTTVLPRQLSPEGSA